jgi:putative ABC transport system ATP-binding protein
LLAINNISKSFQRGGTNFKALDNVSLNLQKGEFVSLIGRSGSGKTTLLNIIAGLLAPDCGQVLIDGVDLGQLDEPAQSALRSQKIGYVPQGQSLLNNLTVLDNVRLPAQFKPQAGPSCAQALDLLSDFGISHLRRNYPASLSGGEARRVALARALINSPQLLIADEPSSDLDIETTRETAEILSALNQRGISLLLVTHDPELSVYGGRALHLQSGRLYA